MQSSLIFLLCAFLQPIMSSLSDKLVLEIELTDSILNQSHSLALEPEVCGQRIDIINDYDSTSKTVTKTPNDNVQGNHQETPAFLCATNDQFDSTEEIMYMRSYNKSNWEKIGLSLILPNHIFLEICGLETNIVFEKVDDAAAELHKEIFVHHDGKFDSFDCLEQDCLKWYERERKLMYLQPINSSFLFSGSIKNGQTLIDGESFWFELHPACRYRHRILVIEAIGMQFVVADQFVVVPVLLKNGMIVGFWKGLKDELDGQWKPILGIAVSLPMPFIKNSIELAREANIVTDDDDDNVPLVKRLFEVFPGDLWLERAALELASVPGGRFPVTVNVANFQVCMHLVGWRDNSLAMTDNVKSTLTMKFDGEVLELFKVYKLERTDYSDHHLLPQRRQHWMAGGSQGQHLFSFPGLFDRPRALNHLLLLPSKVRDWKQDGGIGNKALFSKLFGPLIDWLENPLAEPTTMYYARPTRDYVLVRKNDHTLITKCPLNEDILISYNPLADLYEMEQSMRKFDNACINRQESACAAAEILFSLLLHRCCTLLTQPANQWIRTEYAAKAQRNLLRITTYFVNLVNKLVKESNMKHKHYYEMMSSHECYQLYIQLANSFRG